MVNSKKVANNILDFLIDPTRVPYKERVYTRGEEIIKNESYLEAKADAFGAYRDQKHNSDFYPQKNRSLTTREAQIMDRKSLIASLDVLSKNFRNPKDPFAADLRVMAMALSKMEDGELMPRLASDAPELEEVLAAGKVCEKCGGELSKDGMCAACGGRAAAETFKCPECGTNVLKQTGYCVKCKKKVKKAEEVVEAGFDWGAAGGYGPGSRPSGTGREPGSSATVGGKIIQKMISDPEIVSSMGKILTPAEIRMIKEAVPVESLGKPVTTVSEEVIKAVKKYTDKEKEQGILNKIKGWFQKVREEEEAVCAAIEDNWTKEASDEVARALVAEIIPPEPAKKVPKEAPKKEKAKKDTPVETPAVAPEVKEEMVPAIPTQAATEKKEVSATPIPAQAVVDTSVLHFAGVEMEQGIMSMDDVGEMSEQEKANLAQLF